MRRQVPAVCRTSYKSGFLWCFDDITVCHRHWRGVSLDCKATHASAHAAGFIMTEEDNETTDVASAVLLDNETRYDEENACLLHPTYGDGAEPFTPIQNRRSKTIAEDTDLCMSMSSHLILKIPC